MSKKTYSKKRIFSIFALPFVATATASLITIPTTAVARPTSTGPVVISSSTRDWGVDLNWGDSLTLTNTGKLDLSGQNDDAVTIHDSNVEIYNAGQIIGDQGYYAIYSTGSTDATIVNEATTTTATSFAALAVPTTTPLIYVPGGRAIGISGDFDGTLTNAGIIQAGGSSYGTNFAVGVSVYGGDIDGTITNTDSGQINALATTSAPVAVGVGVYAYGDLDGTVDNSGSINANADTVYGSFSMAWANGIYLEDPDDPYGAYGTGGDVSGELVNSDTIAATGDAHAYGGGSNFALAFGLGVNVTEVSGTITNTDSGTISGVAQADAEYGSFNMANAGAAGLYVTEELSGELMNSGTISGDADAFAHYGSFNMASAAASGVRDDLTGEVINDGTISGDASAMASYGIFNMAVATAYGYHVQGDGGYGDGNISGLLDNNGTIEAAALATAYSGYFNMAIGVGAGVWAETIEVTGMLDNSGTISADIDAQAHSAYTSNFALAYGAGIYLKDSLEGSIINSGTITADASAMATMMGLPYPWLHYAGVSGIRVEDDFTSTGEIINTYGGEISASISHTTVEPYGAAAYGVPVGVANGIYLGEGITTGELTNSGTVSGTIDSVATSGTALNFDTQARAFAFNDMYTQANGIQLEDDLEQGAELNNYGGTISGAITADANALAAYGAMAVAEASDANGILFANGWYDIEEGSELINSGTISGTVNAMAQAQAVDSGTAMAYGSGANAHGILMDEIKAGYTSLLTNNGTISGTVNVEAQATADYAVAEAYGYEAFGIEMSVINNSASLTNTGTMSIDGSINVESKAYGADLAYGTIPEVQEAFGIQMEALLGTLDNYGGAINAEITANAVATATGDYGGSAFAYIGEVEDVTGLSMEYGGAEAELLNSGTISGTINATATATAVDVAHAVLWDEFSDARAIAIGDQWSGGAFFGTLDNSGTLEASINVQAKATETDTAFAYGSGWAWANISGDGEVEEATGIYIAYGGHPDVRLYNSGTIDASINADLTASAVNSAWASFYADIREVYGINMDSDLNGILDNSGTIDASINVNVSATATDGEAYGLTTDWWGMSGNTVSEAVGIKIDDIGYGGQLLNSSPDSIDASINVTATANGTNYAQAWINEVEDAAGIEMDDLYGTLNNDGGSISASLSADASASTDGYGGHAEARITEVEDATGIRLDNVAYGAELLNSGTVSASVDASATAYGYNFATAGLWNEVSQAKAIAIGSPWSNGEVWGTLDNSGTLEASITANAKAVQTDEDPYGAGYAWAVINEVEKATGIYMGYGGPDAEFYNSGTITAELVVNATANAITDAYASIAAFSMATGPIRYVYGINMDSSLSNLLDNSGEIIASADLNANASANDSAYGSIGNVYGIYGIDMGKINSYGSVINSSPDTIRAEATADASATSAYGSAFAGIDSIYDVYGIDMGQVDTDASVISYGEISAAVEASVTAYGDDFAAANLSSVYDVHGLQMGALFGDLANSGTLSADVTASATASATDGEANAQVDNVYGVYGIDMGVINSYGSLANDGGFISAAVDVDINATGAYGAGALGLPGVHNVYGIDMGALNGELINYGGSITSTVEADASASAEFGPANAEVVVREAYGILMGGDLNEYGGFANSGTISATVTASATASGTNDMATAVVYDVYGLQMGSINDDLDNSGIISASATASASAAASSGEVVAGSIMGEEEGKRPYGDALSSMGDISPMQVGIPAMSPITGLWSDGINSGGDLVNYGGTISGTAEAYGNAGITTAQAAARGLYLNDGIDSYGMLGNTGTISAMATADNEGPLAIALAGGSTFDSSIDAYAGLYNYGGTISGTAVAEAAYGAFAIAGGQTIYGDLYGELINYGGAISANATANATDATYGGAFAMAGALNIFGTVGSDVTIENTYGGSIMGSAAATAASSYGSIAHGIFAFDFDGTLDNSGTISGMANDAGMGFSLGFYSGTGTVNNLTGGLLYGNLYAGGSVDVNNSGTIHLPAGADAEVHGDYSQSYGGSLTVGVQNEDTFGNLTAYGSAAYFEDGTNIHLDLEVGPGFYLPDDAYLDDVVDAYGSALGFDTALTDGPISGDLAPVDYFNVTDDSFIYEFTAILDGETIDIGVDRWTFVEIVNGEGVHSATGAAGLFDDWVDNGAPEGMEDTIDTLVGLDSEEEITQYIAETMPLFQGDLPRAIFDALADARKVVRIRQDGAQGANSGDASLDSNFWLKGFGSEAEQEDNGGAFGYEAETVGGVIGADTGVGTSARLGAAFAYSTTEVENNSPVVHEADITTFQGIVYGTFILSEVADIDWQLNYAAHNNETVRYMPSWGEMATADYDSWSLHFGAHYDYRIELSDTAAFTPSIRAEYTKLEEDSFTEIGETHAHDVYGDDAEQLILGVDGTLAVSLGTHALFSANAGVGFDVLDDDDITASFVGDPTSTPFVTDGIDPSNWLVRGGAGLTFGADDTIQFSIEYNIEAREDFINQNAAAKFKIPF